MKSIIKRSLFVGISLALAALTARRFQREKEIQGALDNPTGGGTPHHTGTFAPTPGNSLGGNQPENVLSSRPVIPVVAPTVIFSGTVVRHGPRFALRETAGILYPLDSAGRAWPFEGEDVRVTGKLDLDTRLLYVDAIESMGF